MLKTKNKKGDTTKALQGYGSTHFSLYSSETWTLGVQDLNRIQVAEMQSLKGCTILDKKRSEDLKEELKISP